MNARFAPPELAVVKVGSSSLRGHDGELDRERMADIVRQVAAARAAGTRVVVVSSGAVSAGMGLLGMDSRPLDLPTLQAAAAVGQGELIHTYQRLLAGHGLTCAQILLTQDDFVRRTRYLKGRSTLRQLLDLGAVPVINENDAIATEELSYGDNDHLAALVASMLEARVLLMLSDVEGLHDGDPRSSPDASLIERVDDIDSIPPGIVGGTGSVVGSGGMRTKVDSARVAVYSGAHAVIARAARPGVITDVLAGRAVGTWFVAQRRRVEARRLWIAFALNTHGRVHVDAGAAAALVERGSSLLGVGVTSVDGAFAAGDAIEVVGPDHRVVARGLSNFDAADVRRIAGLSTADAAARHGSSYAREVVHRDDLAIVGSFAQTG